VIPACGSTFRPRLSVLSRETGVQHQPESFTLEGMQTVARGQLPPHVAQGSFMRLSVGHGIGWHVRENAEESLAEKLNLASYRGIGTSLGRGLPGFAPFPRQLFTGAMAGES